MSHDDEDTRARRVAQAMWENDPASRWLGMRLIEAGAGSAVLALDVAAHHCNGHGTCHGGISFSLADSAFAFACNSRNIRTVAQANAITYLAPAHEGDTLTATAREVAVAGRSGLYDVRVTRGDGAVVAEFRGQSRQIGGAILEDGTAE